MLNSESLLKDMKIFKEKTRKYLLHAKENYKKYSMININKEIGHALVHYLIIFIIRSCRQKTIENQRKLSNEIDRMLNSNFFINNFRWYTPSKGNSKLIPLMMKLQFINLLIYYCNYRSNRRYGTL